MNEQLQQLLYWIWFAKVLGPGAAHCGEILALYRHPQELFEAIGKEDMRGLFTSVQQRRLTQLQPVDFAPLALRCNRMNVQIISMEDTAYPQRLKYLPDAPPVLFCTGNMDALNHSTSVGMIGSRRPSSYGIEAARCIGEGLAQAGVCLVSGLADGLDSEAHKAAVRADCPTIGVLGTAIDKTYPATNRRLRTQMEEYGAVISEFAPGETTNAGSFLLRNRLIAGLSDAICVVEAREQSGTMNTVGHAKRYDRMVYAVPGAIFSPLCEGTNRLLEQGEANIAVNADAILKGLGVQSAVQNQKKAAIEQQDTSLLSPEAVCMLNVLTAKEQGLEPLAIATGLNTGQALAALLELEVNGFAVSGAGGQYRRR